jgi:hypothetical protein
MEWAIWICELDCAYPEGGQAETYDEASAFGRACSWTADSSDPYTYRAVRWASVRVVIAASSAA